MTFLPQSSDSPSERESLKPHEYWATGTISLFLRFHGGSHTCTCTGMNMIGREKKRITTINMALALASRGFSFSPMPGESWGNWRILPRACVPSGWFRLNRIPEASGRKDVVQSELTIKLLWSLLAWS